MHSSKSFPKIIYGTAWKKERTATLVVQAVLQGFRAIDTACQPKHYREDLVGQALVTLDTQHGINRDDLFIQSKYTAIGGQDRSLPLPYDPSASIAEQVRLSFSTSLKNLQINHLDSYLLHSPLPTPKQTLEAWGVLMALRDEGKCKMIGISNVYDVGVLKMLKDFGRGADVVQNRWYKGNGFDREVLEYCLNEGIRYESFWTLRGSPELLSSPTIAELSKKKSITPAQSMFLFAQHLGITPLAGTTDEGRMKEDVDVEKMEPLGEEDQDIVKKLEDAVGI